MLFSFLFPFRLINELDAIFFLRYWERKGKNKQKRRERGEIRTDLTTKSEWDIKEKEEDNNGLAASISQIE